MTPTLDALSLINPDRDARDGYPHEEWSLLRHGAPVYWFDRSEGEHFFALTKHKDIVFVSKRPHLFISDPTLVVPLTPFAKRRYKIPKALIDFAPPPKHGPQCQIISQGLTPRAQSRKPCASRAPSSVSRAPTPRMWRFAGSESQRDRSSLSSTPPRTATKRSSRPFRVPYRPPAQPPSGLLHRGTFLRGGTRRKTQDRIRYALSVPASRRNRAHRPTLSPAFQPHRRQQTPPDPLQTSARTTFLKGALE